MGGDGGALASREIMVGKAQKRGLQQDIRLTNHGKTTNCAISGLPLKRPIVACELGMLYNKEAVLTFLLDMAQLKSDSSPTHDLSDAERLRRTILEEKQIQFAHITKLGDVLDCVVVMKNDNKTIDGQTNPKPTTASLSVVTNDGIGSAQDITNYIMCPITNGALDGSLPSILMKHCGCVMSLKGIEQINGMAQRVEDKETGESLRACCLCLKAMPDRYQDNFKPTTPTPDPAPTPAPTTTPIDTITDGKKKKEKKKSQAVIEKEKLMSFPLQEGEEPFIYLIPTESESKILEAIMLARRKHLGRELPVMVRENIKRQRLNNIDNSVEAQRWVQLDPVAIIKKGGVGLRWGGRGGRGLVGRGFWSRTGVIIDYRHHQNGPHHIIKMSTHHIIKMVIIIIIKMVSTEMFTCCWDAFIGVEEISIPLDGEIMAPMFELIINLKKPFSSKFFDLIQDRCYLSTLYWSWSNVLKQHRSVQEQNIWI